MATNDFLPLAIGVGANVIDQATYEASPVVSVGYQSGLAQSAYANKTWRQATFVAAMLAQFMADETGQDVLDDGNTAVFLATLRAAIQQAATIGPAEIITSSAPFTITADQYKLGFARTSGVAAQAVQLPADAVVGQDFILQDLVGNFSSFPVTVTPAAGNIAGLTEWALNVDRQKGVFTYYGSNTWGIG